MEFFEIHPKRAELGGIGGGEEDDECSLVSWHILYSYFIVSMIIVSVELSCMSPLYRDYFSSTVKCSVIFNIPEKDQRSFSARSVFPVCYVYVLL